MVYCGYEDRRTNSYSYRLLDPLASSLTPAAARAMSSFADVATQARIAELADKCNEGQLTAQERSEYAAYGRGIDLITILQSKARRLLGNSRSANGSLRAERRSRAGPAFVASTANCRRRRRRPCPSTSNTLSPGSTLVQLLFRNLALACHLCNLHKGPNLTGIDTPHENLRDCSILRRMKWCDISVGKGPSS